MRFKEFGYALKEADENTLIIPSEIGSKENPSEAVKELQIKLANAGYKDDLGPPGIDGIRGPYTNSAIEKYRKDKNATIVMSNGKDWSTQVKTGQGQTNLALQEPDFIHELKNVAARLGVNANDILKVMKKESNLNPKAVNPYSNATGLIQFLPSTAASLGTSVDDLFNMTATDQLKYVELYLKKAGVKSGMSAGDIYMAVFMPVHLSKKDNFVLARLGDTIYSQNRVLDTNRDGTITVGDVKSSVA